jgi:hypothetical protein
MLILFAGGIQAQRKFNANVFVQVISSKDTPPNDMAKFIGEDLASMADTTVKDKGDYGIVVFIEKIPTQGPVFYAVTNILVKTAECTYKQSIVDGKVQKPTCQAIAQYSSIAFIGEAQLKEKAKEMVTNFNAAILEPERKAFMLNR